MIQFVQDNLGNLLVIWGYGLFCFGLGIANGILWGYIIWSM